MIITSTESSAFITGYTQLMTVIRGPAASGDKSSVLDIVATGRAKYVADRALLDHALESLAKKAIEVPEPVVAAVRSLEVKRWVYLKDLSKHSIFLDPQKDVAYAVYGLTDPIKSILGRSGAAIETGLMRYVGRYACDGIVASVVWLGPGYRKGFAAQFAEIRAKGDFCKTS